MTDDIELEPLASGRGSTPPRASDYEVGYGKPPMSRKFKKGKSGNPKGRPKQEPVNLLSSFKDMLDESMPSRSGGRGKTNRELMMRTLFAHAAECNQRAFSRFLKLARKAGLMNTSPRPYTGHVGAELAIFDVRERDETGWAPTTWKRDQSPESDGPTSSASSEDGGGTVTSPDKKEPADVGQQTPEGSSVGYKRAPRQHRFKAGVSGNRHGRKKGDRNSIALFKEIAMEKVRVRLGDETRIMTRAQAVIYANYAAALKKKSNALANMFLLGEEALEFVDLTDEKQVGCPIGVPARRLTPEEWLSAFGPERKLSED